MVLPRLSGCAKHHVGGFRSRVAATRWMASSNANSLTSRVFDSMKKHPFAANMLIATANPVAADLTTQMLREDKAFNDVDWQRTSAFATFGMVYLGGVQWFVHVKLYRYLFSSMDRFAHLPSLAAKLNYRKGLADAVKQVAFDVFFHLPFLYLPSFYFLKQCIQGQSNGSISDKTISFTDLQKVVIAAWANYRANWSTDVPIMTCVWAPADCLVFAVPIWLRLPVRNAVSFCWTSYLSFSRGPAPQVSRSIS